MNITQVKSKLGLENQKLGVQQSTQGNWYSTFISHMSLKIFLAADVMDAIKADPDTSLTFTKKKEISAKGFEYDSVQIHADKEVEYDEYL